MAKGYELTAASIQTLREAVRIVRRLDAWQSGLRNPNIPSGPLHGLVRRFELKDALTSGESADAYWIEWNSDDEEWQHVVGENGADIVEEVWDSFDTGDLATESRGYAWHPTDIDRWEIINPPQSAEPTHIHCQAAADSSTQALFNVDNVTVMLPRGASFGTDPTQIYNYHAWDVADGEWLTAAWNDTAERWDLISKDGGGGDTVSQTVVTDVDVVGANRQLRKRIISINVPSKGVEGDWAPYHTGDEC